jgi:hypothetical protein
MERDSHQSPEPPPPPPPLEVIPTIGAPSFGVVAENGENVDDEDIVKGFVFLLSTIVTNWGYSNVAAKGISLCRKIK